MSCYQREVTSYTSPLDSSKGRQETIFAIGIREVLDGLHLSRHSTTQDHPAKEIHSRRVFVVFKTCSRELSIQVMAIARVI